MPVFRGEVLRGGKAAARIKVSLHDTGLMGYVIGSTQTASDGRFAFDLDSKYTTVVVYVNDQSKGEYRISSGFASISI